MPVTALFRRGAPAASRAHSPPRKGPAEEAAEDEEGLELPVNPDQGTPLIPDEDGQVKPPV